MILMGLIKIMLIEIVIIIMIIILKICLYLTNSLASVRHLHIVSVAEKLGRSISFSFIPSLSIFFIFIIIFHIIVMIRRPHST